MEALIGGALVTEMGGMLEHAGIEAQAACRQQRGGVAQVSQHLLPEPRLGRSRHQRSQQEGIAQHVNGMGEAEAVGVQVGLSRRGGHETTHRVVEQQQAVEFLQHPQRGTTAQGVSGEAQMDFDLINTQFDLPAFVVAQDERECRRAVGVEQGGDQAMHRRRVRSAAGGRVGQLAHRLRHALVQPVLNHAQEERLAQAATGLGCEFDQVGAVAETAQRPGQHAGFQAGQPVRPLRAQAGKDRAGEDAAIQQDQHVGLHRAQQGGQQLVVTDAAGSKERIDDGMGARFRQVEAARLRKGTGAFSTGDPPKEGGIGGGIGHIFQRAVDGHQAQPEAEGPRGLWRGQRATDLPEQAAQYPDAQRPTPRAQRPGTGQTLLHQLTQPVPGARQASIHLAQPQAREQVQDDHVVHHQHMRQLALPLLPAVLLGQQLAHQFARIQSGEQFHRDQLGQLVTGGQLCYFERHESTPFWLIQAFLLQYARLSVLLSSYLNGIDPRHP